MVKFTKMNGAGNDFVMIDNREGVHTFSRETIARLCDRHRGVGGDGLIAVEAPESGGDFRMRYYNADGREAEMCGNGARCFARFVRRFTDGEEIAFETVAGLIAARFRGEEVELVMSVPTDLRLGQTIALPGAEVIAHFINTGVPHAVVFTDALADYPVLAHGAALRHHEHFAPKGANANFVQVTLPRELAIRTYERGVEGETLACGTGVVAAALLHHRLTGAPPPIRVLVKGGEYLAVGFERDGDSFQNVTLTGPADVVFDGQIDLTA